MCVLCVCVCIVCVVLCCVCVCVLVNTARNSPLVALCVFLMLMAMKQQQWYEAVFIYFQLFAFIKMQYAVGTKLEKGEKIH